MARIPSNAEGYVKASAYILLKRKYTAAAVAVFILFACLLCAVFIRIKPVVADIAADGAPVEPAVGEASDIEAALSLSAQENADLKRQVAVLADELDKRDREYNGASLLEDALQLGHNNIMLNIEDITTKSNAAEYQLNDLLQESRMKGLGWEFLQAEREYGVNAIALIVLTALETSVMEQGSNTTYTLPDRVGGAGTLVFDTYEECIEHMARLLGEEYLAPNGRFFAGKSFVGVYAALSGNIEEANSAVSDMVNYVDRLNTTRG